MSFSIINYIKYGKQIGHTANNGAKAFKRSGKITGIDKEGNVISKIHKYKTGPNTTRTITQTPLTNKEIKESTTTRTIDNSNGSFDLFKSTKYLDEYGTEITVYNKPQFVQMSGNKGNKLYITIDTPIMKNGKSMNSRKTFNVKY